MTKIFTVLTCMFMGSATAQLLTEVRDLGNRYETSSNEVLEQIKIDFSPYIKKIEEFHNNCDAIKENLNFKYATTSYSYSGMLTWELLYHSLEGKKCIKLASFPPRFLNAEDASLLYYVSRMNLWYELPWMAQIKLRYAIYKSSICNLAHFYKRSDVKGYVTWYNLCGKEKLVQGKFYGEAAVIAL